MTITVHNLGTKVIENDSGRFTAVVMGIDVHDSNTVDSFMDHVVEPWRNQWMISDPRLR